MVQEVESDRRFKVGRYASRPNTLSASAFGSRHGVSPDQASRVSDSVSVFAFGDAMICTYQASSLLTTLL